jgi:hypothetical protein
MVEFLPLDAPLAQWIAAVQSKLEQLPLDPTEAVRRMQASDFSVDQCLRRLCAIYCGKPLDHLEMTRAADGTCSTGHVADGPQCIR